MLDLYFQKPSRLREMRRGPLAVHLDAFAAELHRKGYAWNTGRQLLWISGIFNEYIRVTAQPVAMIDDTTVDRFVDEELAARGDFGQARVAMGHFLKFLRDRGVISAAPSRPREHDPFADVLGRFDDHLREVRGLAIPTREGYGRWARRFLEFHQKRSGGKRIASLTGDDILAFVTDSCGQHDSRSWKNNACSAVRVFLRFLHLNGVVKRDWHGVVPRSTRYRLDSVPKHLPWEDVRRLIETVDLSYADGKRDRAILLLLARCGLRSHDVRVLKIDDISWRRRELRLPVTKNRRERVLPLPAEVFEALADYLLHGRPALDIRNVFLRHRAPRGPISSTSGISGIIQKHLKNLGIQTRSRGAHLLRHSLATRMVNAGLPIKSIADVLGHSSIDTTAIYTKVDTAGLSRVAMPLPGGAK